MSIKDHIKKMSGEDTITLVKGTVTAVDKNTDTMSLSPIDGSADFMSVKLQAIDNTDQGRSDIVRYPTIGSFAIIGLLNNDDADTFLIMATKYESLVMIVAQSVKITASGNGNVTIDATKITINGGNNNGLVNIVPLVTKLNSLEKTVNDHLISYKTHVHTGVTTGPGASGPTLSATPANIKLTKKAELEDTKITH